MNTPSLAFLFRAGLGMAALMWAGSAARAQPEPPLVLLCQPDYTAYTCGDPVQVFHGLVPTGTCASNAMVSCTPESGSFLPLGVHPVQCVAVDTCGNRVSCSFTITIALDVHPPVLTCPTNLIVHTLGVAAVVHFEMPDAQEDTDIELYCLPPPGSIFPLGTNVVTCTGYDSCLHTNTCQFRIEVRKSKLGLGGSAGGGLTLCWEGDGVDCADDLFGPWLPAGEGSGCGSVRPNSPAKFFKPAGGPDNGVPRDTNSEIAYVETGLNAPGLTPGVTLRRQVTDSTTTGGEIILADDAGGGLGDNVWSGVVNIPFQFWFYGLPQTKLCVSKNGLLTFSTNVAHSIAPYSEPRKLPDTNLPPNTIQCFASAFVRLEAGNHVRAYLHGNAPLRQVWIIWHGHPRLGHGATTTGLVLEETYNRILMVDMEAHNPPFDVDDALDLEDFDPTAPLDIAIGPPPSAVLAVGIQADATHFAQVPASPRVLMVNQSLSQADNDFYVFKPFIFGRHKHGSGVTALNVVDAEAAKRMKANNIPGATVAVTYKGRLIFNKGYGYANVERDIEMQPWHRAGMGSVSKIFTAVGIFKAIELGAINSVEDSILKPNLLGKPWFTNAFLEGIANGVHPSTGMLHLAAIKLKHLLSHTAGYAGGAGAYADFEVADLYAGGNYNAVTYTNSVQYFMSQLKFLTNGPGLLSSYANQGFGQLGVCIEQATGMSYVDFMQRFVLQPIGITRMRMRTVSLADEDPIYDARRYHWYSKGRPHDTNRFTRQLTPVTYDYANVPLGSQGSWTATAADMARLMCATDRLKNHADVLTTNSLNLMESDPVPAVGSAVHGWFKDSNGRLSHNGSAGSGSSFMMRNTNQINVAVICNTANAGFCTDLAVWIYNKMVNDAQLIPSLPKFYDLFPSEQQLQLAP